MSTKYEDGITDNLYAFFSNIFNKNSEYKTVKFLESILIGKSPKLIIQTNYYSMEIISRKSFKNTFDSLSYYRKKQLRELIKYNDSNKSLIAISIFLYFLHFKYHNVFLTILDDEILVNGCCINFERLF